MHYLEKELYEKIRQDASIFMFLQDAALDGVWYWDLENPEHEWLSEKLWKTFGYDPSKKEHLSREWQDLINQEDLRTVKKAIYKHLNNPQNLFDEVVRYQHKSGHTVWVRCRGIAIFDGDGKARRMLGAHTDVTELKNTEHHLRKIKDEYETVFKGTQDALFLIDVVDTMQFRFIRNNPAHQTQTGLSLNMLEGKTPQALLGDDAGDTVSQNYQRCVDAKTTIHYEEVLYLPAGERIWQTTLTPIIDQGVVTQIVGSGVDITARKALEKALEKRANYDGLTNLANRDYMTRTLIKHIRKNEPFTLVFIDVDNFKSINDAHGHSAGDRVLKTIAARLEKLTKANELVARLGGDEFIIIKTFTQNEKDRHTLVDSIFKTCSQPIPINDHSVKPIKISVGLAHYPEDGKTYDDLMHKADQAMYAMKRKNNA